MKRFALSISALILTASLAVAQTNPAQDDCEEAQQKDAEGNCVPVVLLPAAGLGGLGTAGAVAAGVGALAFVGIAAGSNNSSGSH